MPAGADMPVFYPGRRGLPRPGLPAGGHPPAAGGETHVVVPELGADPLTTGNLAFTTVRE